MKRALLSRSHRSLQPIGTLAQLEMIKRGALLFARRRHKVVVRERSASSRHDVAENERLARLEAGQADLLKKLESLPPPSKDRWWKGLLAWATAATGVVTASLTAYAVFASNRSEALEKMFSLTKDQDELLREFVKLVIAKTHHTSVSRPTTTEFEHYVPLVDDDGKTIMIKPCDKVFAWSSRSDKDKTPNALERVTKQRTWRARQLDHIEDVTDRVVVLLAKMEQLAENQFLPVERAHFPVDVVRLTEVIAGKGPTEGMRKNDPHVLAALHAYLNRNAPARKLAIKLINRFHGDDWQVPWTLELCDKTVEEYVSELPTRKRSTSRWF
jgi:hypothetical protein